MRGLPAPALRQLLSLSPQWPLGTRPSPQLYTRLSVSTQRFFVIRRSDLSLLQQLLRLDRIRAALRITHVFSVVCVWSLSFSSCGLESRISVRF